MEVKHYTITIYELKADCREVKTPWVANQNIHENYKTHIRAFHRQTRSPHLLKTVIQKFINLIQPSRTKAVNVFRVDFYTVAFVTHSYPEFQPIYDKVTVKYQHR